MRKRNLKPILKRKAELSLGISLAFIISLSLLFNACSKDTSKSEKLAEIIQKGSALALYPGPCPYPCGDPRCAQWNEPPVGCNGGGGSNIVVNYAGVNITYETQAKILKFNSVADINKVIDQLDTDYENYNTNYENQYPDLTADQLDSVDQITGFDEFRTYRDFENMFPYFTSKRSNIETIENTWLANNLTGADPDSLDFTFDESENALFNSNYLLKIGTTTYQMTADGLIEGSGLPLDRPIGIMSIGCFTNKREKKDFPSGDRKYRLKVAIHSILIRSSVKGKVVSLKKKSGGGYKRSRADLAVSVAGTIYDGSCSGAKYISKIEPASGFKKRKQLKARRGDAGITYRTMPGELGSRFDTPSGFGSLIL